MTIKKNKVVDNAKLMAEWDWGKNAALGLDPNLLTCGSGEYAFWKCAKCGYEWPAKVYSRNNDYGCPACAGKILLPGQNDLATKNPVLAKEWNYCKNGELTPDRVAAGSDEKVYWICSKCGYDGWYASIGKRNRGEGCPVCAGKIVLAGYNDLATVNPSLAAEWDYEENGDLLPTAFTANSHQPIHWKCSVCGHKWTAAIASRNRGHGCEKCGRVKAKKSRQETLLKKNGSLAEKNPTLAEEWNYERNSFTPAEVTLGSHEIVWWKCPICGYEWQARIKDRNSGCYSCKKCTERETNEKKAIKQLKQKSHKPNLRKQTSFPEQAIFFYVQQQYKDAINRYTDIFDNGMELDIYIPSQQLAIEYDGAAWHKTAQSHKREILKYRICQNHSITLLRVKENLQHIEKDTCDILLFCQETLDKTIIQLAQYITLPSDIDSGRDKIKIEERYYSALKENSITIKMPELAKEWHPTENGNLTPDMFTLHSSESVMWKCQTCGYEWSAAIARRTIGDGCPVCAGRIPQKGVNDLATVNPHLARELLPEDNDGLQPDELLPGSNIPVQWTCYYCGHKWRERVRDRSRGKRCPICKHSLE